MSYDSNSGSVYYELSCGIPSTPQVKASGYDLDNTLYAEAVDSGIDGNDLVVYISVYGVLSSFSNAVASVNNNYITINIPYKKYMLVENIDFGNPANNFIEVFTYVQMSDGRPEYNGTINGDFSRLYFDNDRWVLVNTSTTDETFQNGYENYPSDIEDQSAWIGTGIFSAGVTNITDYNDYYSSIATANNNVPNNPLTIIDTLNIEFMEMDTNVIYLTGGSGVNINSNRVTGYYHLSANDFILWGQDDTYTHPTTNKGSNPYYLECDRPSDAGLDLNSNKGTKYYYSSAFNCVSFCD